MKKIKVAVLVSGGGTNLQAILDAEKDGIIANANVDLVISNKAGAYALERAKNYGVATKTIIKKNFESAEAFEDAIIDALKERNIDLIVLAGFMSILSKKFTDTFKDRIINVHPSLIPSFCGDGFYGLKVHEKALEYGVKVTGATVHFVNEITDGGTIIAQKAVEIQLGDTPEILQKRVMEEAEWILLPQAIEEVSKDLLLAK
ncbi:MAG: phosphoribosylglycinamide formyltransferase [Eubacteriales bacterium]|nr:phosphoribosylglycinamide formyltransferase [Eubacteriales bacterium]MDY3333235.1 phosphoribosylglycinamide formyltransferase [Gallibacter sp.]